MGRAWIPIFRFGADVYLEPKLERQFSNTKVINEHTYFTFESSPKRCNLLELAVQYGDSELVNIVLTILTGDRDLEDSKGQPLIIQAACRGYSTIVEGLLKTRKFPIVPTLLHWLSCIETEDIYNQILGAVSETWLDESVLDEPGCLIARLHPQWPFKIY